MTSSKNRILPLIAIFAANGLVYGFNALYYCFIQIYLEQFHSTVAVGVLLSIGPLVAIVAPIFWGLKADRAKYKNTVLLITIIGSAILYFALKLNTGFIYQFIILTILMFFMSPFGGLIDIITLEYTEASGFPYGPIRLSGTFVFGIIPMVLTIFTEKNIDIIFYAYIVFAVICSAAVIVMPKVEGHAKKSEKQNIVPLFLDVRLMTMFAMVSIAQFAWAYYLNFFPTYITDTLGFSQRIWGINVFITVLGEIPFFLWFNKLFKRFGIKNVLIFAIIITILRYLALGLFTTELSILIAGLISGVSVTVFTYCGSYYITHNIDPRMKASAQTLMYALGNSIPKMLAGLIGGVMTTKIGVPLSMMCCVALSLIMVLLYAIVVMRDRSPSMNGTPKD